MPERQAVDISSGKKFHLLGITLTISLLLMTAKVIAYFLTGSNAILSDAAESLVNIVAGAFALYSVWLSAKPRDREHPYGHGKVEFLSAGLEGFLIIGAALVITGKSIYDFFEPKILLNLNGSNLHIDCHMTMPWYWDLKMMHHELDLIEDRINDRMGSRVELFIHVDPCIPIQCRICHKSDCEVRQHDFVQETTWTLATVMTNQRHGYDLDSPDRLG